MYEEKYVFMEKLFDININNDNTNSIAYAIVTIKINIY